MEFDHTSFRSEDFPFLSALFPENNPLALLKPEEVDDENHHFHHPPSNINNKALFHNFLVSDDDDGHEHQHHQTNYSSSSSTVNSSYIGSLTNDPHHHQFTIEGSSGSPFLGLSPTCTNGLDGESQPTDHLTAYFNMMIVPHVTQGAGMEDEANNFLQRSSWTDFSSSHEKMISSLFVTQPLSDYQTEAINYKQQEVVDEDDDLIPCLAAAAAGQDISDVSAAADDHDDNQRIVSSKRIAVKRGNRKSNSKVDIIKGQWTPQEDR